jgi:hypothetical protein
LPGRLVVSDRVVGKLVLAVLAAAALLSGCGSSSPHGVRLPFKDDFSGPTCAWSTKTDPSVALACTQGTYRVLVKRLGAAQNIRNFLTTEPVELLSVGAGAVERAGPKETSYGVTCWNSREKGYAFVISPGGAWRILKLNLKADPPETALAESSTATAIAGLGMNRIRGDCRGEWWPSPDSPHPRWRTTLTLSVNGRRIAATSDADSALDFAGFGLFVAATRGGTEVRFDNVAARRLSAKPNCTSTGIRYVGTTDQDTAVCLTLSPGGKRLREIGFDAATSCPARSSSALVHNEFEGVLPELGAHGGIDQEVPILDKHGNQVAAYLFRGSINGAVASGVLSNRGFCESLKVRWIARRVP